MEQENIIRRTSIAKKLVSVWCGLSLLVALPLKASVVLTVPVSPPTVAKDSSESPIELDLDGGGTIDFMIPGNSTQINVMPEGGNRVLAVFEIGSYFAIDLSEGSFIGATPGGSMEWIRGGIMSACFSAGGLVCFGNFLGGVDYLGVEFDIAGNTHYGWVEVESLDFVQFVRALRWAYETEPGVPIRAGQIPEPSTIVFLVASLAFAFRRARDRRSRLAA